MSESRTPPPDPRGPPLTSSGPILVRRCRHGTFAFNRHCLVGQALDLYGEWAEPEVSLFAQMLRPGDIAIDAGAYIGTHTVFMARQVGPSGRVYAFEPQRIIFQTLCANQVLNGLDNVEAFQIGLGSRAFQAKTTVVDYQSPGNFAAVQLSSQATAGETIQVRPLDDVLPDLPACKLLKVDVEGMELEVLEGAERLIMRTRPFIYAENNRRERSPGLLKWLTSHGYRPYWHLLRGYNPNNFYSEPRNIFGAFGDVNVIAMPEETDAKIDGATPAEDFDQIYDLLPGVIGPKP